ncbi:cell division ATP-binding protein FtsE [Bifidobacterium indicum]|uniref:cell division ATP-binding protein FtsE n=1 Tax=Bifidobacterium indicum TaxID=1691 RepID=UPI0030D99550
MALISLKGVTKIYPKGSRPALDNISLAIDRGDFVFLVGASGSGKTTLLRLLLHEEEATEGEIRVAGNDLRRLRDSEVPGYRRSIGFVFQDYKLLTNKTVWQNVAFTLEVIGARRSTIKTLVPQVLKTVGLTGKEDNYPHELSGGEAQRVALARAYVNHPQILLADEPTGNLDPTTSLGIMEVLDAINRTGTTVVMATHNEEIVNSMRKRVVELHTGKIMRDQEHGSYDSSKFFPDAEVEAKAHHAIRDPGDGDALDQAQQGDAPRPKIRVTTIEASRNKAISDGTKGAVEVVEAVAEAIHDSQYGDEGIARLANSVHSGRTGRYGEVFTPVETTLTWGKGIKNLEEAGRNRAADQASGSQQEADQTDSEVEGPQESDVGAGQAATETPESGPSRVGADADAGYDRFKPSSAQTGAAGSARHRAGQFSAQGGQVPARAVEPPVQAGRSADASERPTGNPAQANGQKVQSSYRADKAPAQAPPAPPTPPVRGGAAKESVQEDDRR